MTSTGSDIRRAAGSAEARFRALFERSLNPTLVADDERRYVDANPAASLLLRLPRQEILRLRVDDLTPPELRPELPHRWQAFLDSGTQTGRVTLMAPDGTRLDVDYSAKANFRPGLHLGILLLPHRRPRPVPEEAREGSERLTSREREVLSLIARGKTGQQIGEQLSISVTTVQTHVRNAMGKLNARTRAHAIVLAMTRRELDP
jgi:PAS domain S-box-containing protein